MTNNFNVEQFRLTLSNIDFLQSIKPTCPFYEFWIKKSIFILRQQLIEQWEGITFDQWLNEDNQNYKLIEIYDRKRQTNIYTDDKHVLDTLLKDLFNISFEERTVIQFKLLTFLKTNQFKTALYYDSVVITFRKNIYLGGSYENNKIS